MNRTRAVAVSSTLDGLLTFNSVSELKEECESEIRRLTEVRDDASVKLGMVKTIEDAERARKDADDYASRTRAAAEQVMASAASRESDAKLGVERAVAREKTAKAKEDQALKMQDEYNKKDGALAKNMAAREADVIAKERNLSEREAKLKADAAALAERAKRLDDKIAAVKAMAV